MKKITFQIFDQGLDISLNNNHYSLCDLKDLQKQKNARKFKQLIIDNLVLPIDYTIVFENFCKNKDYQSQVDYILNWVGIN
jgi:hypothetical protein